MIHAGNLYQHADGDVYRVTRIYNTNTGVRVVIEVKESETRKPAGSRWTMGLADLEEMIAVGDMKPA